MDKVKLMKKYMKPMMDSNKGQVGVGDLPRIALLLGIAGVIGLVMAVLLQNIEDSSAVTANSTAENISSNAQGGLDSMYAQFDLIGLIFGLVVVVAAVLGAFAFLRNRGSI